MKSSSIRFDLSQIFGIDRRSMALFRIGLALVLLGDLFRRACDIGAFYTDTGVLPRSAQIEIYSGLPSLLSFHLWSGSHGAQMALFGVSFAAALALLVGYRTLVATLISWILLVSLHSRNPMTLQGGDVLLRLMLFWSLFLPLGALASLDALLAANSKQNSRETSTKNTVASTPEAPLLSTGTLAALLQLCFVYWFTAAMKTDASWRVDGTALGYALSIDQIVKPFGRFLLGFSDVLRPLTFLTLAIERFGPFLALLPFWRLRLVMVAVFIGFHFVMGLCLTLGIFTWIAPVAWLLFIPPGAWNWLENRLSTMRPSRVQSVVAGGRKRAEHARQTILARTAQFGLSASTTHRTSRWKSLLAQTACGFFLLYVFGWNLRIVDNATYGRLLPQSWNWIGLSTGLDQIWNMFSPFPLKEDGWFVAPAQLADGTQVNLIQDGEPVSWEEPANLSSTFRDPLWQKYLLNLWSASNSAHRAYYAAYLVRQWNETHPGFRRVKMLQLVYMQQTNLPNLRKDKLQKIVVWQQSF